MDKRTHKDRAGAAAFETLPPMLMAGLAAHYDERENQGIPSGWGSDSMRILERPGQIGDVAYGVCMQESGENTGFRYIGSGRRSVMVNCRRTSRR